MEIAFFIVILAVLIGGFVFLARQKRPEENKELGLLLNQMNDVRLTLERQMGDVRNSLDKKLDAARQETNLQSHKSMELVKDAAERIKDITEKLTKLDATNQQVVDFADQLQDLQDILKNPKQRGIAGEYLLETVLKNVLPPGVYQMQYPFLDGVIVDAIVRLDKEKIIPIDSKFSLENYNRFIQTHDPAEKKKYETAFLNDIKLRIDETSKYVKPSENTMEFAFMFIPSEAVYYDLLINKVGAISDDKNMISYAWQKKVIIVSPTSFLAYLQTVLQGLKNQQISEKAGDIVKQVDALRKHLGSYDDYMQKLGKNLGTTVGMYNSAYKEFAKIDKDFLKITDDKMGVEPLALDKPQEE
ncbi:MAG: DNA recombination protein RmuC [bacterium]|nr:DNA recombination protein RmuC [bacterium]